LANCSNAGSLAGSYAGSIASSYAGSDLDDGWESDDSWEVAQTDKGDSDESLHTARSVDQLNDRGSICDENKDIGKVKNNQLSNVCFSQSTSCSFLGKCCVGRQFPEKGQVLP
uniref:OTU family cysteine protease n=1 Tax=Anisakis simplex TaxID=6269 RepID=A0A0M3JKD9_ANISI